jgi:hypothetical protein
MTVVPFPVLSRSGHTAAGGKRVALPRIFVDEVTAEGMRRLAAEQHMPFSEFARQLCEIRVHGIDGAQSIALQRLQKIAGIGSAIGSVVDAVFGRKAS